MDRTGSTLRLLTAADLPGCMRLKDAAGWNQTEADWLRLLDFEPAGLWGIEVESEIAASGSYVRYGSDLAWIGMVLTHPGHRRRGYARRIMEHLLAQLDRAGVAWAKLDATDLGQPLYESLGFAAEAPVERWLRPASRAARVAGGQPAGPFHFPAALDRAAFGADRGTLIARLAAVETCGSGPAGYALGRPGSRAAYFGPCIAESGAQAGAWLAESLARHAAEDVFWDLLPDNAEAKALAASQGFTPVRRLVRMGRSLPGARPLVCDNALVYAIAGFEFG